MKVGGSGMGPVGVASGKGRGGVSERERTGEGSVERGVGEEEEEEDVGREVTVGFARAVTTVGRCCRRIVDSLAKARCWSLACFLCR